MGPRRAGMFGASLACTCRPTWCHVTETCSARRARAGLCTHTAPELEEQRHVGGAAPCRSPGAWGRCRGASQSPVAGRASPLLHALPHELVPSCCDSRPSATRRPHLSLRSGRSGRGATRRRASIDRSPPPPRRLPDTVKRPLSDHLFSIEKKTFPSVEDPTQQEVARG